MCKPEQPAAITSPRSPGSWLEGVTGHPSGDSAHAPRVYHHVRDACHAALRNLFVYVATPIEGPGKKDHGDLDILVATAIHAEHAIIVGQSANYAIPWPSSLCADIQGETDSGGGGECMAERHIQVDVRVCEDERQLSFSLFKHAHGDIWNLLGSTIRPYGLTVDEDALWLRIPEIEKFNRNTSKVLLTTDPVEILHFLGMKVEGFWTDPFDSVEALFDYATTCRLFWVQEASPEDEATIVDTYSQGQGAGVTGGDEGRKKLKHNDRRRMNGRPVFRRWINEFIPQLRAQGRFLYKGPPQSICDIRATVRDEAFSRFSVEHEYRERLRQWRLKTEAEQMKGLIKAEIPTDLDPQRRACVVGAMRRIMMEGDLTLGITPSSPVKDAQGFYDMEAARAFVVENWERLCPIAWSNQQKRAMENMRLKELKKMPEAESKSHNLSPQ
ncbi:hypothetical protein B0T17DRAFT_588340 [Bombardia bombarda]|uniref:Uncharacterized protein n=1 Tax=Bombardia bombarda TaxID=252184 RepID=A0AA40C7S8_9PEZI|nr:hypothetical protein B0T17DRAFT_588340 [Bombardia bombarda]